MKAICTLLLTAVVVLLSLSALALCAVDLDAPGSQGFFDRQTDWLPFGLAAFTVAVMIDYRWLNRFHLPHILLGLCVVSLILVWVPGIGVYKNGAHRWIRFGQPSEAAKLGMIIWLAAYCVRNQSSMSHPRAGLLIPGGVVALVAGLIFLEPDWGTAALVVVVSGCLLIQAGTRWQHLLKSGAVVLPLFLLAIRLNPLRWERILAFLHPENYQWSLALQPWQTMRALALGGLWGVGAGRGIITLGYVPEQETDFILSVIGEEWGLVGTGAVWAANLAIFLCGMAIAARAVDPFGRLLATGLSCLIGLQAFLNLGVATSLLPNKGISLPFVSYGGSNLIVMMTAVGMLISVARISAETTTAPPPASGNGTSTGNPFDTPPAGPIP